MLVCPYDCHWCDVPSCRAAGCELTAEPPLVPCIECGVLISVPARMQFCVACMTFEAPPPAEV